MKTTFPEVALYITSQHEHGFFHVYAVPVLVGTERPDSIRNPNDYSVVKGGWFLHDFRLYSQANEDRERLDADPKLYGFTVEYNTSRVTLADAQRMTKTLRRVEAALDKLTRQRGYVTTYGEYVARVAEVLGCKRMVFSTSERGRGWSWDDTDHAFTTLADGRHRIEAMERKWREGLHPQTAPAVA